MKNTLENKARFFALYWGQIMIDHNGSYNIWNGLFNLGGCALELTPLSQITDEDAIEYFNLTSTLQYNKDSDKINDSKNKLKYNTFICVDIKGIDYLRSKGYALPFMRISVETLIEWNWIKLKSK